MKTLLMLFLLLIGSTRLWGSATTDSLLNELNDAIARHQEYVDQRERRIARLKARLSQTATSSETMYRLNHELYEEYKSYICDSAILYLDRNLVWADSCQNMKRSNEARLRLVYLMSSTGMYREATDLLGEVRRDALPEKRMPDYYETVHHLYGELGYYTQDMRKKDDYRQIAGQYNDSLWMALSVGTPARLELEEAALRRSGHCVEALAINDSRMAQTREDSPAYALVTYHRAMIYRKTGDREQEKQYLIRSALTDIRLSIKDHASLWNLAEILYGEGDIERAYQYIRFSWSETNCYNARSRSLQTAGILSLIDLTYQAMREKQNDRLCFYLVLISTLSVLLVVAVGYIYRQMKRLSVARNYLEEANRDLSESNHIKEEYIGRFIKLCSTYIDKLDTYRRMVNKKITAGQTAELQAMVRSRDVLEDGLKELYENFDIAFLRLFPDFVERFNDLLQEEERIVLRKGELLNTELRIFALIRLGIDDSSQIAEFLRYSVNTIYNYRAKVKNKARIARDDFESRVLMIK